MVEEDQRVAAPPNMSTEFAAEVPVQLEDDGHKLLHSRAARSDTNVNGSKAAYQQHFSPVTSVTTCMIVTLLGLMCMYAIMDRRPVAPVEGPTCFGVWPAFESLEQLQASEPWNQYLQSVYGSLDGITYPMCSGDLWMLYVDGLRRAGVENVPGPPSRCPSDDSAEGYHYMQNSRLSPPNVTWSWHPHPAGFQALANDTWVEVLHKGGITDEHTGAWFLRAYGSGIWLSIGRSLAFDDHEDAYAYFGLGNGSSSSCNMGACNEALCQRAAAAGFDSLQFVRHTCQMMYGDCLNATASNLRYWNHEVVHVRLQGIYTCASANGSTPLLQTGWPHAGRGAPCTCNNNASTHLHCSEVAASL